MESRILIADSDQLVLANLRDLLRNRGYIVDVTDSFEKVMDMAGDKGYNIIILGCGGYDNNIKSTLSELKTVSPDSSVIVTYEVSSVLGFDDYFNLGVQEIIAKPINREDLLSSVRRGLEWSKINAVSRRKITGLEEQNTALQKQNTLFQKRIEESTKNVTRLYDNLRETYMHTIRALAHAIDTRDHYTGSHSVNVSKYAVLIANEMKLTAKEIEVIREACELHDLGKVGIQDCILSKPTKLTDEEWEIMKTHAVKGAQILEPLTFLSDVIALVREHHERYDGTGYPFGHKGEAIPLGARIICLADTYDAMTSARSYRKVPLTKDETIEEIVKNSGTQFDPRIVEVFLKVVDRF